MKMASASAGAILFVGASGKKDLIMGSCCDACIFVATPKLMVLPWK
jgi:hypothetical protein